MHSQDRQENVYVFAAQGEFESTLPPIIS